MGTFRLPESEKAYRNAIAQGALAGACPLCAKEAIKTFTHWRLIVNDFPYDKIARVHHMLIPKRCVPEGSLTSEEREELLTLKSGEINEGYEYIIEALHNKKSIPGHFHLHCVIVRHEE
ncbi:MAG: hypothetical protein AAB463_00930 [Patescibacteria group bacterium]